MDKILKKIKVVFVDFEECLCISMKHTDWQNAYASPANNPYMDPTNCCELPTMRKFLSICRGRDIMRVCMADVNVGFGIGNYKSNFAQSKYGASALSHLVHISDVENRLNFIMSYCTHQMLTGNRKITPDKCLIVTADMNAVKSYISNGFSVMTPQELVARMGEEK